MIKPVLLVLLYLSDVGLDVHQTGEHYRHCHYAWFRLSCIHLAMPYVGYAINLLFADVKR